MSRKHWLLVIVVALAGVIVPGLIWSFQDEYRYARIATGYAAKQTCSCLHISGRTMESCLGDFPADARENISIAQEGAIVRASVLFGAISASASYEESFGCTLLD